MDLIRWVEARVELRKDEAVIRYLETLTSELSKGTPELESRMPIIKVFVEKKQRWKNFGIPGSRVYLSAGLLRALNYENEVAAVIAMELAHIQRKALIRNIQERIHLEKTKGGIEEVTTAFTFPEEDWVDALPVALEMLYQAGFDPRGMVSLLGHFKKSKSRSPYPPEFLEKLLENARRHIALQAPLRNPIVRSERFLAIRPKLQRL